MPSCPACRTRYPEGAAHCPQDGEALLDDAAFSNVDPELAPGDMVGEYRIEGKIGAGGFGAVYAAVHPLIGKRAALKTLHRQHSTNPQIVARFIAEAKAVNQIRHRNIIDIFSFGNLPDGRQYFLMELLEGRTFEDYFRAKGKLTLAEALPILRGVARALDAAHAKGIAHRDLKPENIFLVAEEGGGYTPKLLDFGVAKLSQAEEGGVKTRTGAPIGTPYYMSPEQARGLNVDSRTDIYALGVVCFQVLTGQVPFDGTSLMDVLMKHMSVAPRHMSDVDGAIPQALDAPVLHMLAKDPSQRPSSVGAAIDELEAAGRRAGCLDAPFAMTPSASARLATSLETDDTAAQARTNDPPFLSPSLSIGGTTTPPPVRSSYGKPAALVLGLIVVVGAGVAFEVSGPRAAPSSVQVTVSGVDVPKAPPAPDVPSAAIPSSLPSPSPSSAAAASSAEVTVISTPPGATVSHDGQTLGIAPGPFTLPVGSATVTLTVTAPGYEPGAVDVVPTGGKTVSVLSLNKKKAQARAPISRDLDDPFKK